MRIVFCIWLCLAGMTTCVNAAEIAVTNMSEGWASEDGKGFVPELFQAVKLAGALELDLKIVPFARALEMFKSQESVCFVGGDEQSAIDYAGFTVIASEPFIEAIVYAFTLRTDAKITNVEQLRGKRIGLPRGLNSNILGLEGVEPIFDFGSTVVNNFKKLKAGRIDVMVEYYFVVFPKMLQDLHYAPELILYQSHDTLICHPHTRGKAYIEKFNKGIRAIRDNGTYQKIYEKYYHTQE